MTFFGSCSVGCGGRTEAVWLFVALSWSQWAVEAF